MRFFALSALIHGLPLVTLPALGMGYSCDDTLKLEAARRERRELLVVTLRPTPVDKQGLGQVQKASGQSEVLAQPALATANKASEASRQRAPRTPSVERQRTRNTQVAQAARERQSQAETRPLREVQARQAVDPQPERVLANGLKDLPVKVALAGVLPDRKSLQPRELLLVSASQQRREQPWPRKDAQALKLSSVAQEQRREIELVEPAPSTRRVRVQIHVRQLAPRPRIQDGEAAARDDDVAGDHSLDADPLVHAIAEAVARVLPYVYWDWPRRGHIAGHTVVRFRLNADGYVDDARVIRNDGTIPLARESGEALTLASPYDFVPGWIELSLTFRG